LLPACLLPACLLPVKLDGLLDAARYKIIYGGRGSGKSWSVARAADARRSQTTAYSVCARVPEFTHRKRAPAAGGTSGALQLSGFYTVRKSSITGANGTEFVFAGLRHNISKIKSFEGTDIVWVEEGQNMSKHSFDVLLPTIVTRVRQPTAHGFHETLRNFNFEVRRRAVSKVNRRCLSTRRVASSGQNGAFMPVNAAPWLTRAPREFRSRRYLPPQSFANRQPLG
jgi:hypothetical protein